MNKLFLRLFTFFISIFWLLPAGSQSIYNLVPNYSFEDHSGCQCPLSNASSWLKPSTSSFLSIGYCNSCVQNTGCSIPVNIVGFGYQYARTGNAYAFGYMMYERNSDRGYMQTQLTDTLKAGHCYYAEFYVNLVNAATFAINNIGMLFGNSAVTQGNSDSVIIADPQILTYGNPILPKDTANWIKVSGIYIANGGEKFITIGNFKKDEQTDTSNTNFQFGQKHAEYYFDDVSVIPIDPDNGFNLRANAGPDTTVTIGDSVFIGTLLGGTITTTWYNSTGQIIATDVPGLYVSPTQNTYYVLEQNICGITTTDSVFVTVNALPLKLLTFTAKKVSYSSPLSPGRGAGGEALLQWTTANELNLDHFEIQKSTNGREFSTIGTVKANPAPGGTGHYAYTDNQTGNEPTRNEKQETFFYRLKMLDHDGKFTYSPIRSLTFDHSSLNITVYPNPTKDKLQVQINSDKRTSLQLQVVSIDGKVLLSSSFTTSEGSISRSINITTLPKGTYYLKVATPNPPLEGREAKFEKL